MTDLEMIRALLNEAETELAYNKNYAAELDKAESRAAKAGASTWDAWKHMSPEYDHSPRKSVILDDLKMVRRLCLKICKEVQK